eukprot:Amastigsp_a850235_7.p2 type:complete len:225 gc:universal Amastigsp_a850235_7:724-1398(+)
MPRIAEIARWRRHAFPRARERHQNRVAVDWLGITRQRPEKERRRRHVDSLVKGALGRALPRLLRREHRRRTHKHPSTRHQSLKRADSERGLVVLCQLWNKRAAVLEVKVKPAVAELVVVLGTADAKAAEARAVGLLATLADRRAQVLNVAAREPPLAVAALVVDRIVLAVDFKYGKRAQILKTDNLDPLAHSTRVEPPGRRRRRRAGRRRRGPRHRRRAAGAAC